MLWFDALIGNVDRSWRNPNLLLWHGRLHLIDHGAALTFHHTWAARRPAASRPYDAAEHVLAGTGPRRRRGRRRAGPAGGTDLLEAAVAEVPDVWLADEPGFDADAAAVAGARYVGQLTGAGRRPASRGCRAFAACGDEAALVSRVAVRVRRAAGGAAGGPGRVDERRRAALLPGAATSSAPGVHLDADRLRALDPAADPARSSARCAPRRASATPTAAGPAAGRGPGAAVPLADRAAQHGVQPGPVHTGLTEDPEADLDRLLQVLVLPAT